MKWSKPRMDYTGRYYQRSAKKNLCKANIFYTLNPSRYFFTVEDITSGLRFNSKERGKLYKSLEECMEACEHRLDLIVAYR